MLDKSWNNIESLVIYGLGIVSGRFMKILRRDFEISYIIDKNKHSNDYEGIPIYSYEIAKQFLDTEKKKIVVLTTQRVYEDIKQNLEADGFIEEKDFCRVEQFVVEWYRRNKNKTVIVQLHTAVTTWCTLNCKKCNMFMSHYSNETRHHYSFVEMKADIDLAMSFVDYICLYNFLGGEPLLNGELKDIINYVATTYGERVGRIGIITNGTVEPDEETLLVLTKHNVLVFVSDYTLCVPYYAKLDRFCQTLSEYGIEFTKASMTEWKDFGFPEEPFDFKSDQVYTHMKSCSPMFHGLNDKKLFYCHVVWSAEKAGIYRIPESDYIDLSELNPDDEEDRKRIGDYCMGKLEHGYLDFCRVCGGCGADNTKIIVAGEQT